MSSKDLGLDPGRPESPVRDLSRHLGRQRRVAHLLREPRGSRTAEVGILDKLNAKLGLQKELRNLLAVLIDNNRIGHVAQVAAAWRRIFEEQQGIRPAEIVTARELSKDERVALAAEVAKLAGAKIDATFQARQVDSRRHGGAHRVHSLRRLGEGTAGAAEGSADEWSVISGQ